MDNVHNCDSYMNIPWSQTYTSYFYLSASTNYAITWPSEVPARVKLFPCTSPQWVPGTVSRR
jgi:hypothetical protein